MRLHLILGLACLCAGGAYAALQPGELRLDAPGEPNGRLPSNSIIDAVPQRDSLWLGTGQGLSQLHLNNGSWATITQTDGIGQGGVSAIAVTDSMIWAATAYSVNTVYGWKPAGGGIGFSRDGGVTWTWMPQPKDSADVTGYKPTTTNIQNVIYDIALSDSAVWIASYGGGVRRLLYSDFNADSLIWRVHTPDGKSFDAFGNLNHRGFSAAFAGHSIFIGTAQGINRSDDEGLNWTQYTHSAGSGLTGEFVTALATQEFGAATRVWAATWMAENAGEYYGIAVTSDYGTTWRTALSDSSYSTDDGVSWQNPAPGNSAPTGAKILIDEYGLLRAHNFGFDPASGRVWAATDYLLWFSDDSGATWSNFTGAMIRDNATGERLDGADFFSAAVIGDSVFIGTDDGLAIGWPANAPTSWRIHRAFRPAGVSGEPDTYAYPNPFSPVRGNLTRLQIRADGRSEVSLDIYNFAMEKVFGSAGMILPGRGSGDMSGYGSLMWDGRDSAGKIVANGVYFYRVKIGGNTAWGKVMVLD